MGIDAQWLALDLISRTEKAVEAVAHLAVDTGVTFTVEDIVEAVERDLPEGYPAPTVGTRADVVRQMAVRIISGEMYEGS